MELSCLKLKLTVDRLISPLQIVTWPLIKTLIKSWNTRTLANYYVQYLKTPSLVI